MSREEEGILSGAVPTTSERLTQGDLGRVRSAGVPIGVYDAEGKLVQRTTAEPGDGPLAPLMPKEVVTIPQDGYVMALVDGRLEVIARA